ncbi:MAG: DUF971 domain-containing protein [Fimbriiglobus sp.]
MAGAEKPQSIKKDGDGFRIVWADGVSTFVAFRTLRQNCPCAACLDAKSKPVNPFKVLSAAEVAAGDPIPVAMKPVGHYAYQITWNDGHDTGIFTLQALRQLSQQ